MNQSNVRSRKIYNSNMLNRSAHSKNSFSQIEPDKSVNMINQNQRNLRMSLIQRYRNETEEIKIKKMKKNFHIQILAFCIIFLVVSELRIFFKS